METLLLIPFWKEGQWKSLMLQRSSCWRSLCSLVHHSLAVTEECLPASPLLIWKHPLNKIEQQVPIFHWKHSEGVYWASNSSYWSWAQWTLRGCSQPPTTCGWDMSLETFYYRTHPWSEYKEGWGTGWGQLSRTAAQILPFRPGSIFGWNRFEVWDHTGNTDLWGWGERASARDRTLAFNLSRSKWIEPGYQPTSLQYSGLKRWEISELHTLPSE